MNLKTISLFAAGLVVITGIAFGLGQLAHYLFDTQRPTTKTTTLPKEEVKVRDVEGLIKALRPHRTILLEEGDYVFKDSNLLGGNPGAQSYGDLSPYYTSGVFRGLEDVAFVGLGKGARILQPDGYAWVLSFLDVKGLTLKNLVLGHDVEKGFCQGGVLRIVGGDAVRVSKVEMFGSGTEGISLVQVKDMTVEDSLIHDCTESLMSIAEAEDIRIVRTSIKNNNASLRGFSIQQSQVEFVDSEIVDNVTDVDGSDSYGVLFLIDPGEYLVDFILAGLTPSKRLVKPSASVIKFRGGKIKGNNFKETTYDPAVVSFEGTTR